MPQRTATVLAGFLVIAAVSCGKEEPRGPTLAGGREVSSWVDALKDRDPNKRRTAVLKLGNVGDTDPAAAEALAQALGDSDAKVRRDAVMAVVKLKSPGETILARLKTMSESDKDARAKDLAKKALDRLQAGS